MKTASKTLTRALASIPDACPIVLSYTLLHLKIYTLALWPLYTRIYLFKYWPFGIFYLHLYLYLTVPYCHVWSVP